MKYMRRESWGYSVYENGKQIVSGVGVCPTWYLCREMTKAEIRLWNKRRVVPVSK